MKKVMVMAALAASMLGGIAQAAPTLQGETGLINVPSADVIRSGKVSVGYFSLRDGHVLTAGAGFNDKIELTWSGNHLAGTTTRNEVNMKFGLLGEKILLPGVVIGISDITAERERSVYAVTSKSLPLGLRLHIGVGNGRYDGVFAGVEKRFFPGITTMVEYDGEHVNVGGRVSLPAGVQLNAGWRQEDKKTYFGVSMTR